MASVEADRPRARIGEARRNRVKLVAAATEAFASGDQPIHLEAIARAAGVGIGTLYRHFPTRESLVEAVYLDQVGRLRTAAQDLLAAHPPAAAFREWMSVFLEWAATKHGMGDTLRHVVQSGRIGHSDMRASLIEVVSMFLEAGVRSGDFRSGIDASDVAALLAGVLIVAGGRDQRSHAEQMLQIVVDGMRPPGGQSRH